MASGSFLPECHRENTDYTPFCTKKYFWEFGVFLYFWHHTGARIECGYRKFRAVPKKGIKCDVETAGTVDKCFASRTAPR